MAEQPEKAEFENLQQQYKEGNYRDVLERGTLLLTEGEGQGVYAASVLEMVVACLEKLNRQDLFDALAEGALKRHADNAGLMAAIARGYLHIQHRAERSGDTLQRARSWGYLDTREYDRLRALQIADSAFRLLKENSKTDEALLVDVFSSYTDALRFYRKNSPAQFALLTDLKIKADFSFKPELSVKDKSPDEILHTDYLINVPAQFESARSDAERWRFLLSSAIRRGGILGDWGKFTWSRYLEENLNITPAVAQDPVIKKQLKQLADHESFYIYQGQIERISLPQYANFIELLVDVATRTPHNRYTSKAAELLAHIYEKRDRRADTLVYWRIAEKTGDDPQAFAERIKQITKSYGRFEPSGNNINLRYRNAQSVSYSIRPVDTHKVLEHIKNTALAKQIYSGISQEVIGSAIVTHKETLLEPAIFQWRQPLKAPGGYEDEVIQVDFPGTVDGPYMLVAELEDGNITHLLRWQNQRILASFPLDDEHIFYLADALTGRPMPAQKIHFWSPIHSKDSKRKATAYEFARKTNKDGWVNVAGARLDSGKWLIYAEHDKESLSFLNFSGYWTEEDSAEIEEHMGVFFTTHQPAYRPGQTVKFKGWVRSRLADRRGISLAGMPMKVVITDTEGRTLLKKTYKLDKLGGFHGELVLAEEALLGVYDVSVGDDLSYDSFVVEEYKKPEFIVKIDQNLVDSQLAEKIRIPISAQYYYGQPVRNAEIRYEINGSRSNRPSFLQFPFDWLYDINYAWFPETDLNETFQDSDAFWERNQKLEDFRRRGSVRVDPATGVGVIEIDLSQDELAQFPDLLAFDLDLTVTDESRRSVELSDSLSFSKAPHQVYAWLDKGFYRAGDSIRLQVAAQTSVGNAVSLAGELSLLPWDQAGAAAILRWNLPTDNSGNGHLDFSVDNPGLYRLRYEQVGKNGQRISAERKLRILTPQGLGADTADNELVFLNQNPVLERGGRAQFFVASNLGDKQSILLISPTGIHKGKKIVRVDIAKAGESLEFILPKFDNTTKKLHAVTVGGGRVFTRDLYVPMPPVDKFLNIEIQSDKQEYKPGEKTSLHFRLKDHAGKPVKGELVVAVYDRALEPFAAAIPDHYIQSLFYKEYDPYGWGLELTTPYIDVPFFNEVMDSLQIMQSIGLDMDPVPLYRRVQGHSYGGIGMSYYNEESTVEEVVVTGIRASVQTAGDIKRDALGVVSALDIGNFPDYANLEALQRADVRPVRPATVRSNFRDSIYWHAKLPTSTKGKASVQFKLPDNLTTWKIAVWAMAENTRVGQAKSEIRVNQPLVLRAQTPRFLVEEDEVTLSANIMNNSAESLAVIADIKTTDNISVTRKDQATRSLNAQGELRADWQVRALAKGPATVTMTADAGVLNDAVVTTLPVKEKGHLITRIFQGTMRDTASKAAVSFEIPERIAQGRTQLELEVSSYLIAPALKALPYLAGYPYGCSEQTLNRFLPSAISLHVLEALNLDLAELLQAMPKTRGPDTVIPPPLDKKTIAKMIRQGMSRLGEMQNSDGGWDWFPGSGKSYVHTTAVVIQGLTLAKKFGVAVDTQVLNSGLKWLEAYQALRLKQLLPTSTEVTSVLAGHDDALVAYILAEHSRVDAAYLHHLYQHSPTLSHYGNILLALAFHLAGDQQKRDAVHALLMPHLKQDEVAETAYLQAKWTGQWWRWYNSDVETQAHYLMYLNKTDPHGQVTSRVARHLVNNRTHGSYWDSTRDSALAIEALLEYFQISQQRQTTLDVAVTLDNKIHAKTSFGIGRENRDVVERFAHLHEFNSEDLAAGLHQLSVEKHGAGELYYTAYLNYFSKENALAAVQSGVGIQREYYLLRPSETNREGFIREKIAPDAVLKSGGLVEVELFITSANDYEYILIEDRKPAGFEALENRSGYKYAGLSHYVEYRDDRVSFFVRNLGRGEYRLTYRAKAEIPGKFTALPASVEAMYFPRLRANSDSALIRIED